MLNINFVPDDYVQGKESHRTNFLYLILFAVVIAGLVGIFVTIKVRQRGLNSKELKINEQMAKAQESIAQLEQLQSKRKTMMKTALTTSELIEPVPRSVLVACLTNNLPPGASLLELTVVQKEPSNQRYNRQTMNKYQSAKSNKPADNSNSEEISKEKLLQTYINIEGIAPSDFDVATYIERLNASKLVDDVALVESKEYRRRAVRVDQQDESLEPVLRQFKLNSSLKKGVHLSEEDIDVIRKDYEESPYAF
jgi:Tfp pilus assembly protein PilN